MSKCGYKSSKNVIPFLTSYITSETNSNPIDTGNPHLVKLAIIQNNSSSDRPSSNGYCDGSNASTFSSSRAKAASVKKSTNTRVQDCSHVNDPKTKKRRINKQTVMGTTAEVISQKYAAVSIKRRIWIQVSKLQNFCNQNLNDFICQKITST